MVSKSAVAGAERGPEQVIPGGYDVLILDASVKQSLAGVRSLGRAGLRVAAGDSVAQFDPAVPLPAFRSRYCQRSVTLPDLVTNTSAFVSAVIEFVRENSPRAVMPTGDITIGVLRPYRQQLAALGCFLALAPDQALEIANDKDRTLAMARELGILYPRSVNITDVADIDLAAAEFGYPFVLKPTISWDGRSEERLVPVDVTSRGEAAEFMTRILGAGSGLLAQEWVPGRREGVSLFVAERRGHRRLRAHRAPHESPAGGCLGGPGEHRAAGRYAGRRSAPSQGHWAAGTLRGGVPSRCRRPRAADGDQRAARGDHRERRPVWR